MAQVKNTTQEASASSRGKRSSVKELKEKIGSLEQQIARYAAAEQAAIHLRDVTKTSTKVINTFSKDRLRTFLQNIGSNEANLRNLSWYLFYRSQTYARIIHYYANMFYLNARSVIPEYDPLKQPDNQKILKSWYETLTWLEAMHLQQEFLPIYLTCFVQDIFYGIHITDETGTFIWQIPADYARINGKYMTGDFSISMNMSYLRSHQEIIEYIPEPLESMYREFENTREQWQPVPDEYAICLKFRYEDFESIVPPFIGIFNALINLSDLEDIQAIADEQEIYKLLWMEMETIGEDVDDWKVNPDLSLKYFGRLMEALPPYISAAIVPGKLQSVGFDDQISRDTTKVSDATKSVLNTSGGAEILNGETISGAEAFRYSQIANTEYAISSLLPQTEAFVNRKLSYLCSNPSKVKFFPISVYTREQFKEDLLKAGQYSLPVKLAYLTISGLSEKDGLSLLNLENNVLKLQETMIYPLHSSFTQSNKDEPSEAGRPADEQISTDGEKSAEKRDAARA